ncbi:ribosome silencing factor [Marispirochaeta sp.]|jgi:ribosome-associated protein|uniref:ribosome silencing factor n=1 Tax=Marispirochaeta sp. TaxID=2038653 RepID=UPI0029C6668C|nr:ribosome silencing factor [Marispirochaeta sp.]
MDATVKSELAKKLGEFINDHQGNETLVLDVSQVSSWTDYFIITTVRSTGHLKGLVRNIQIFLNENEIPILHRHKKIHEEGWVLIDCGFMVVHLMDEDTRNFYELEKLWYSGETVFQSSKSS